jgi:SAM-dependent methyltransferase
MSVLAVDYPIESFARRAAQATPPGARILDAGAGDSPYREFFTHAHYEAADVCVRPEHAYAAVDYVCELSAIPVDDERYDVVLCTQVLEHVADPPAVLRELRRVLKPAGTLWVSAPLYFPEHEVPYDYYRYTQFAWHHLLAQADFELLECNWGQGYAGTVAHQLNLARHQLPSLPSAYGGGALGVVAAAAAVMSRPLFAILAVLFSRADRRYQYVGGGHPIDYCVIARRGARP